MKKKKKYKNHFFTFRPPSVLLARAFTTQSLPKLVDRVPIQTYPPPKVPPKIFDPPKNHQKLLHIFKKHTFFAHTEIYTSTPDITLTNPISLNCSDTNLYSRHRSTIITNNIWRKPPTLLYNLTFMWKKFVKKHHFYHILHFFFQPTYYLPKPFPNHLA